MRAPTRWAQYRRDAIELSFSPSISQLPRDRRRLPAPAPPSTQVAYALRTSSACYNEANARAFRPSMTRDNVPLFFKLVRISSRHCCPGREAPSSHSRSDAALLHRRRRRTQDSLSTAGFSGRSEVSRCWRCTRRNRLTSRSSRARSRHAVKHLNAEITPPSALKQAARHRRQGCSFCVELSLILNIGTCPLTVRIPQACTPGSRHGPHGTGKHSCALTRANLGSERARARVASMFTDRRPVVGRVCAVVSARSLWVRRGPV